MQVPVGDTYYFKFTTRAFSTGAPTTLSGTPVISVYEENNLTQITAGITLTADYDSVTGLNDVAIVATGANGYEVGKYYDAVITTGTVGGVSVVGEVVGHFRVMPAEDAGAGIPDVNVTHVGDSAQDIATATALATVDSNVDAILLDTGTDGVVVAAASKTGYTLTATTGLGNQTANITGNLSGSVGSVTGAVGSVTGAVGSVTGNVGGIAGTITTLDALDTAQDVEHDATQAAIAALNDPTAAAIRAEIDSNSTQLAAIVADTGELQTDWANGGRLDLILDARASQTTADAIEADTQDIQARSLSVAAAAQLEQNLNNCITGTASGTPAANSMVSDVAVTVDDQFKGRIITFDDDTTTAALRKQSTDITACTAASNTLTFTALTTAPVSGDTFTIT